MLGILCVTKLPDFKKSFLFAFQSLVLLTVHSQEASELLFIKWSGELNVPDPVAIAFDDWGNAYVTQTERRKVQDLDIRQHPQWLEDEFFGLRSEPARKKKRCGSEERRSHWGRHQSIFFAAFVSK